MIGMRKGGAASLKELGIYAVSIWKRMWRTPGYPVIFLLVPVVLVLLSHMTKQETVRVMAAVYLETSDGESGEEIGSRQEKKAFIEKVAERLSEREGAILFVFCDSEEEVQVQVASGKAQCGYVLSDNLMERLAQGRYTRSIKSYKSPSSSQHTICDEVLFAEIFSVYEEETFGEQVSDFFLVSMENGENDRGGKIREEIKERADELFEEYLYNGSTFQFIYENYGQTPAEEITEAREKSGIIPVRGIMALMIYICGLCGTLEALEDEAAGRILRLKYRRLFQILTICIPPIVMGFAALIVFAAEGSLGDIGNELFKLLLYQIFIIFYGCILKRIWRKEERFLAAMPVFILSAAVVCPVFIDLSTFLPVFKVLEKLYPLSYYLRL